MVSVSRPRIVSRSAALEAEDLPEQVSIGLRELVGAAKEGLLALSVGVGRCRRSRAVRSRGDSTGRSERQA